MGPDKIAQIGIEKAVAVHHQDRVGFDAGANKAKRARGSQRFGLDLGDDVDAGENPIGGPGFQVINNPVGKMPQPQDDSSRAAEFQPVDDGIQKRDITDRSQQLRRVAQGVFGSDAQPSGKDDRIDVVKAGGGH